MEQRNTNHAPEFVKVNVDGVVTEYGVPDRRRIAHLAKSEGELGEQRTHPPQQPVGLTMLKCMISLSSGLRER